MLLKPGDVVQRQPSMRPFIYLLSALAVLGLFLLALAHYVDFRHDLPADTNEPSEPRIILVDNLANLPNLEPTSEDLLTTDEAESLWHYFILPLFTEETVNDAPMQAVLEPPPTATPSMSHDDFSTISLIDSTSTDDQHDALTTWTQLINQARNYIDILRPSGDFPVLDERLRQRAELVLQALRVASTNRSVDIRVVSAGADALVLRAFDYNAATKFALTAEELLGTQLLIVDDRHVFVGGGQGVGVLLRNAELLSTDAQRLYEMYWQMEARRRGEHFGAMWPAELSTEINEDAPLPMQCRLENAADEFTVASYLSSAPALMNSAGRTHDLIAAKNAIETARKSVLIAWRHDPSIPASVEYWPTICSAIIDAAQAHHVSVRLLVSVDAKVDNRFLHPLQVMAKWNPSADVQIKRSDRRSQSKFVCSEHRAYVGASNWFGVGFTALDALFMEPKSATFRTELEALFWREWNATEPMVGSASILRRSRRD